MKPESRQNNKRIAIARLLILICSVGVSACNASSVSIAVQYQLEEYPLSNDPGGCLSPTEASYSVNDPSKLPNHPWALNTQATVWFSFICEETQDNGDGSSTRTIVDCPAVPYRVNETNQVWRVVRQVPATLVAQEPGEGGFWLTIGGEDWPPVRLEARAPAALRVERSFSTTPPAVASGVISELELQAGQDAVVAVTFTDAGGNQLCGSIQATAISSGGRVRVEGALSQAGPPYINGPFRITAEHAGVDQVIFTAGSLTTTLTVDVLAG